MEVVGFVRKCVGKFCPCLGPRVIHMNGMALVERQELGQGGYSFVSLVEEQNSGQRYALKKTLVQTPEQMKEATWELEVLRALLEGQCAHIVRLHDSTVINHPNDTSQVLALLDYFPRGSMHEVVEENAAQARFLAESQILSMFLDCCEAVLSLHTHSPPWAHNDIKPGNFLVSNNDRCVLTDFGSVSPARVVVKSRVQAMQVQDFLETHSTPGYRAPELFDIASDCTIDERTDVWSLGCLLYAFAFGKNPFESSITEKGGSLALAVASGRYKYPETHPYSDTITGLIDSMLQTDPASRPFVSDITRRIRDAI